MSIEAQNWARKQEAGSMGAKFLLWVLADHVRAGENTCYPSTGRLASIMECSRATVFSHLATLEERHLLRRNERNRKGGAGRTSNLYSLAFEPDDDLRQDDHDADIVSF